MEEDPQKFKVSFIGPCTGGKTSIITRFHSKNFTTQVDYTIGASFISHTLSTSNGDVTLHIWDTAGQERYKCLVPMYFRGSAALVVVFDISSPINFESAKEWCTTVNNEEDNSFDLYFVANKMDLQQNVSREKAEEFAKSVNATYLETSAKTGENVDALFEMIAENISKRDEAYLGIPISDTEEQQNKSGCCK
ncbi:Ras-related protein Rab-6A [Tritrichomonas foetus]|uniref:Ras-related protein Rab-6A n=1 Tax=Tritrichomonas foetus TaxID=1144522 RepID=A0A1J4KPD6_9EUKA|nr:Ras-related protein Rab-6A [Tritrichomonas foetus]|eukprot:OHT13099.1 Ras-related protein Rab-6A [Tritrichomonas foetus]